jgi:hypothetical protein
MYSHGGGLSETLSGRLLGPPSLGHRIGQLDLKASHLFGSVRNGLIAFVFGLYSPFLRVGDLLLIEELFIGDPGLHMVAIQSLDRLVLGTKFGLFLHCRLVQRLRVDIQLFVGSTFGAVGLATQHELDP